MNANSSKISGLVITFNEEKNIEDVIQNLNFTDEIIIVDSFSTDKTAEICKKYSKVTFIQNEFSNFTAQRNFALSRANNPWILFLDADERISEELKSEILQTVSIPNADDAYFFYRKFIYIDKPLCFSGWQTDKNIRLFKKDKGTYVSEKLVHEKLKINGNVGKLKNKLIHYSFKDYNSYKQKMIQYGKLKAKELFIKGRKPNLLFLVIKPLYKFFHSYFLRLGILDGKKGLVICYLNALSIYVRFSELSKLYKPK